jgi:hypothetical protein
MRAGITGAGAAWLALARSAAGRWIANFQNKKPRRPNTTTPPTAKKMYFGTGEDDRWGKSPNPIGAGGFLGDWSKPENISSAPAGAEAVGAEVGIVRISGLTGATAGGAEGRGGGEAGGVSELNRASSASNSSSLTSGANGRLGGGVDIQMKYRRLGITHQRMKRLSA